MSLDLVGPRSAAVDALRFPALGGTCELYAVSPCEPLADTAAWIASLHRRLTRFDPDSELSRFNARAGEWVEVSPVLEELLREALVAYETSGGLVHCGVLPALVAAGYDRTWEFMAARTSSEASWRVAANDCGSAMNHCNSPTHAQRDPLPPLPDLLQVRLGEARLAPGAAIDLGGIAKGWIADRAVERLGPNALASCAGDLMALGPGPTGEGWPVGFGDRTVLLDGMGAATSGTTKRRWGNGLHHLIDPRTGRPAATDLAEASVLARSGMDAEVLAKAALLLGSIHAPAFLEGRALGWALS